MAFIGTASLGDKLAICGYTLWHMMSSFVALGWANQQHQGELLVHFALKQPRDGGGVRVGQQCSLPLLYSSTQSCLAHCEDMCRLPPVQQDSLGKLPCSQQGRDQQEVPRMFSSTCTPWGNHCMLQQGWTIFKVFFLAATHGLTGSAISLSPLAHSISPFLTTSKYLGLSWVMGIRWAVP